MFKRLRTYVEAESASAASDVPETNGKISLSPLKNRRQFRTDV